VIKWLQGYTTNKGDKREMKKPLSPKPGRRSVGGRISQRLQLTEVGKREELRTSFVSELGTAVERRWYLGWFASGSNRFVNVFFLNCGFTAKSTEQGTVSERAEVWRTRRLTQAAP
jgi:hypothetical protein